jgi:hypothetical protein
MAIDDHILKHFPRGRPRPRDLPAISTDGWSTSRQWSAENSADEEENKTIADILDWFQKIQRSLNESKNPFEDKSITG